MIPKTIHYCWFGRNPLPASAVKCIDSWRRLLPQYQIKEWNEDNFDVGINKYVQDAYGAKKYAFVSDFARFWIIYNYGGVYFDVDVEVVRPIDDIVEKGPFWGLENDAGSSPLVAAGLGIGAEAKDPVYKEIMERYNSMNFFEEDGSISKFSMNPMISELFISRGLKGNGTVENVGGHYFYPRDYFNPLDYFTGRLRKTENTRSIHWFMASWLPEPKWKKKAKQLFHRILGVKLSQRIKKRLSI